MVRVFVNDPFLLQAFFPSMFNVGINGGTWSLGVEMFLYFLFPFLMLLSRDSAKILIPAIVFTLVVGSNVAI
jgi:peptidoglycan/LPS O-acetylase OafA/YrhL